jgi:hypothetical protein
MIDDLDEALRAFLTREMGIKNGEVEIEFKQPTREWSGRLSRPTLNLYLHDVRENAKLRRAQPGWEIVERGNGDNVSVHRRNPVRLDLHYLITAWATEPEDEHRLLGRALLALYRYTDLPTDILPESLQDQPTPIAIRAAQTESLENPNDFWSVMDNQMRPGIACVFTMSIDPFLEVSAPIIRTRATRFGQAPEGQAAAGRHDAGAGQTEYLRVTGRIRASEPLEKPRLIIVENGRELPVIDGGYVIARLQPGEYTLELSAEGLDPQRFPLKVPAPSYDLEVKESTSARRKRKK